MNGVPTMTSGGSGLGNTLSSLATQPKPTMAPVTTPSEQAPAYSGPQINSLTNTAKTLGVQHNYDPSTGQFSVNGQKIPVTSIKNGNPYGNVAHMAAAAGHNTIQNLDGTVSIHPLPQNNTGMNTPSNPAGVPINSAQVGANMVHGAGNAATGGINGVVNSAHNSPFANIGQSALQGSGNAASAGMTGAANGVGAAVGSVGSQMAPTSAGQGGVPDWFSQMMQNAPQAPTMPQIPGFTPDYSNWQTMNPWNYDQNAAMQNAYNMYAPQYQQQMNTMDNTVNEQMNSRGLYNSGIAQSAVNDANAKIYGQMQDAMTKYITQDRAEAWKEWLGQANLMDKQNQDMITNQLNAYKANVDTMYKNGQLSEQQYTQEVNKWHDMLTTAANVYDQQEQDSRNTFNQQEQDARTAANNQASWDRSQIPYTQGPTPQQQITDELNQQKTDNTATNQANQLDYKWYTFNHLSADQQQKFAMDNKKLDVQKQQIIAGMQKAMLPYQYVTKYQQQEIALKQQAQAFTQQTKQIQIAQGAERIALAQSNASFNQWAKKQQIDQNWQKLSDSEKQKQITNWMNIEKAVNTYNTNNSKARDAQLTKLTTLLGNINISPQEKATVQSQIDNLLSNQPVTAENIPPEVTQYVEQHPSTSLNQAMQWYNQAQQANAKKGK